MYTLGITGGLSLPGERDCFTLGKVLFHDAAAVLLHEGHVVAAIEEERLNRIKHTNKFPLRAIDFCLRQAGIEIRDVDRIAYYADDSVLTAVLQEHFRPGTEADFNFARELRRSLEAAFGVTIEPERMHFIRHHLAHAASAFAPSGFSDSLILTVDAMGERESALVLEAEGDDLRILRSIPVNQSLGFLYADLIRRIGFEYQEEYKVMGLAPYGDAYRYASEFAALYTLLPNGEFALHRDRMASMADLVPKRRREDPIDRGHMDFAAALQCMLERIVMHILEHFRADTGRRRLCLAGGVAQNCAMTGKLLASGLFDQIFVQPAAYDAGCALGAALLASETLRIPPLRHVYWGTEIGSTQQIAETLRAWAGFVSYSIPVDLYAHTAALLSKGNVIGWVQGHSEFGPRALGNRSIIADARPAANREILNSMVKKREAFRPFAPAVLEEHASRYFDLPPGTDASPFMSFALPVRESMRALLGAVTHVDGSARVQTVSRAHNPRFWALISAFGEATGVPVVLNTSFNSHCEPIVDSVEDAIVCFLTTGIDLLVVGDFVVERVPETESAWHDLVVSVPTHLYLSSDGQSAAVRALDDPLYSFPVSAAMHLLLSCAGNGRALGELLRSHVPELPIEAAIQQLRELWVQRAVVLRPSQSPRQTA